GRGGVLRRPANQTPDDPDRSADADRSCRCFYVTRQRTGGSRDRTRSFLAAGVRACPFGGADGSRLDLYRPPPRPLFLDLLGRARDHHFRRAANDLGRLERDPQTNRGINSVLTLRGRDESHPRLQAPPPRTQNLAQCGWLSGTAPLAAVRVRPSSKRES